MEMDAERREYLLRMPRSMKERIEKGAAEMGIPQNSYMIMLIERGMHIAQMEQRERELVEVR